MQFTERAQLAMSMAAEEADLLNCGYVGTEHLLLALVRHDDWMLTQALAGIGIDYQGVLGTTVQLVGIGQVRRSLFARTPEFQKVVSMAEAEAAKTLDGVVSPAALLGAIACSEGTARRVLDQLGAPQGRQLLERVGLS